MFGVLINAAAVFIGSVLGLVLKRWMTPDIEKNIQRSLGFCTLVVGVKMALRFENILLLILCVVFGGVLGHFLRIDEKMEYLGEQLRKLISKGGEGASHSRFASGFALSSILYCSGAMAIIGSIEASLSNNHETLLTKAMIDGILSAPMGALYGLGSAFSALSILIYQGSLVLLAKYVPAWNTPQVMNNISGVGGIMVTMIGAKIAHLTDVSLGAYFPAVFLVLIFAPFFS